MKKQKNNVWLYHMEFDFLVKFIKDKKLKIKTIFTDAKYYSGSFGCCAGSQFMRKIKPLKNEQSIIVLHERHYIAVHMDTNKNLYFFDSCNDDVCYFVKNWADKYKYKIIIHSKKIQDSKSILCGLFCLDYLMNGYDLSLTKYNLKNTKLNNQIVIDSVKPDGRKKKRWNGPF